VSPNSESARSPVTSQRHSSRSPGAILDRMVDRSVSAALTVVPGRAAEWYATPGGRKKVRYALVSVVAVPFGTLAVALFDVVQRSAGLAAVLGNSVGAIPSYLLNRYWVWQKNDRNHLLGEILPFWMISLVAVCFSLLVAHEAGRFTREHELGGTVRVLVLLVANVASFGVFWVAKYVLFNRLLFTEHTADIATTPSSPRGE
jgi:putative flippase GtrA